MCNDACDGACAMNANDACEGACAMMHEMARGVEILISENISMICCWLYNIATLPSP